MNAWQRRLLWVSASLVALTGWAYAWMRYGMRAGDPFSAFHHPLQPWALAAHVLLAPLLLFVLGWFWGSHVLAKLRGPNSRLSGLSLLALVLLMTASGYGLQVTTAPGIRVATAWAHGISGTAFFGLLLFHAVTGRRAIPAARGKGALDVTPRSARRDDPDPRPSGRGLRSSTGT